MGRVILFSEFEQYHDELTQGGHSVEGTILDANIIITLSYSPKKYHTRLLEFLSKQLYPKDIPCFTTVNTTFEYLEFYRRILMTEGLRDVVDEFSKLKLPNNKRRTIRYHSGRLKHREENHGADPVLNDREIKDIRNKFSNSGAKGLQLWNKLCQAYLNPQLQEEFDNLKTLGVKYLSIHEEEQKKYFTRELEWKDAIKISATTCASISDSMILNALQSTAFPFAISLDLDVIYATLTDHSLKDILVPDDLISDNHELKALIGTT